MAACMLIWIWYTTMELVLQEKIMLGLLKFELKDFSVFIV